MRTRAIVCLYTPLLALVFSQGKPSLAASPLPPGATLRLGSGTLRHGGAVHAVAFSPDGKAIASASADGTISLWNPRNGSERVRLLGHGRDIRVLAFSPDGRQIASGSADQTLRIWDATLPEKGGDLQTRPPLKVIPLPGGPVDAVAFSPNGKQLAAATDDGVAHLFALPTYSERKELSQEGSIRFLTYSPEGDLLATSKRDEGVLFRHPATGQALRSVGDGSVRATAFSPDGKTLAFSTDAPAIQLCDPLTGKLLGKLDGHERVSGRYRGVYDVAFSPNGALLASAGADGTARLWDARTHMPLAVFPHRGGRVLSVAFSPDGSQLVSGGADHAVRLWDIQKRKEVVFKTEAGGAIRSLALDARGHLAAAVDQAGHLTLWRIKDGLKQTPPDALEGLQGKLRLTAFSPESDTLLVADASGVCHLVSLQKRASIRRIVTGVREPTALALTPDGQTLILAAGHPSASMWSMADGKRLRQIQLEGEPCDTLALSPDGKLLAEAGSSPRIRIWDIATGRLKRIFPGHLGGVLAIAWTPDGRTIVSTGKDRRVRTWEAISGQDRQTLTGLPVRASTLAIAPGTGHLILGDETGAIHLWSRDRTRELRHLQGHRGGVTALRFLPGQKALLSAGQDGSILVWDIKDTLQKDKVERITLGDAELLSLWDDLASPDAATAMSAVQTLGRAPQQTVPLIQKAIAPISAQRVNQLLKDLDNDAFSVRDSAMRNLTEMGPAITTVLQKAIKAKPSLEALIRMEELLQRITDNGPHPEYLRALRAIEILELCGSPAARETLQRLASGQPDAELTRQATAAHVRLKSRDP